ncbi:hypothetical protein SLEP1_g17451 [Rubroshorea leprosula]|uniref:Uncharacterized protein n=1 Tax=Rubroshorea leprosula TaxID=152421 RepID=A0AAV5IUF4_9ROSI|nr:hypothetical protein SLEP1_g17451 [Rubroshorea leprosula]
MIFPYFLVQEPDLEPRNSPPCRKLPDLLCPSSPVRRLLLLVGCDLLRFWNFPSMPPALPQIAAPPLLAGFWFPIVLSVST